MGRRCIVSNGKLSPAASGGVAGAWQMMACCDDENRLWRGDGGGVVSGGLCPGVREVAACLICGVASCA